MEVEGKKALLRKIKILAERGEGGERESAQKFLSKLLKKYGLSEQDLNEEIVKCEWFRYKNDLQCRLLKQIIWMVTGDAGMYTMKNKKNKVIGADCTSYQRIEIEVNYEFFKKAMEEEINTFYRAFCNKNELFPVEDCRKQFISNTKISLDEAMKMEFMMEAMEKHSPKKMIGAIENRR